MSLSSDQLLSIVRNYWPSSKDSYLKQEVSPEVARLQALWEQELKKIDRWWSFLEGLERELPGFTIGDATATPRASFRCAAYPAREQPPPRFRWVVVGCVSILAPVYTVYGVQLEYRDEERIGSKVAFEPLPPEIRATADVIARRIEATFGCSALPREVAETPVPLFVEWKEPPDTPLFHALFTSRPESLP